MFNRLKAMFSNGEAKNLISNFLSLSVLQLFSYIFPLITIPFLIRVLGDELYGSVILAQTTIVFFTTFIDFGFDLSATRDVSVNRENESKIVEIFSSVLILKCALYLCALIALLILLFYFDFQSNFKALYLLTFIPYIGQIFFPIWYFQGYEKMTHVTVISVLSRVIFTICIFVFVKSENDYLLIPIINGLGLVFSGLFSMKILKEAFNQKFKLQSFAVLRFYFRDSFQFFLSRLSSVGYTNLNTLVVGVILSPVYVTYYHLANRVISVILSLFNPVVQSIYPYLSKAFKFRFLVKIVSVTVLTSMLISLFLYFLADYISIFLLKEMNVLFVKIYRVLLFLIPISILYVMIGAPLLLARGFKREFNMSIIIGFIIHFISISAIYLITLSYEILYSKLLIIFSWVLVVTKLIVLALRLFYVKKNNLHRTI